MGESKTDQARIQDQSPWSVLEELAREGARQMLATALEAEVAGFIAKHQSTTDEQGHRIVVRNGSMPEPELITGIGPLAIKQPRGDDRGLDELGEPRFSSAILPRYMRRVANRLLKLARSQVTLESICVPLRLSVAITSTSAQSRAIKPI